MGFEVLVGTAESVALAVPTFHILDSFLILTQVDISICLICYAKILGHKFLVKRRLILGNISVNVDLLF